MHGNSLSIFSSKVNPFFSIKTNDFGSQQSKLSVLIGNIFINAKTNSPSNPNFPSASSITHPQEKSSLLDLENICRVKDIIYKDDWMYWIEFEMRCLFTYLFSKKSSISSKWSSYPLKIDETRVKVIVTPKRVKDIVKKLKEGNSKVPGIKNIKVSVADSSSAKLPAFARGSRVVLTSGLLDAVTSDDVLALIIGHEMSHALMNHRQKRREFSQAHPNFERQINDHYEQKMSAEEMFLNTKKFLDYERKQELACDGLGLYLLSNTSMNIEEAAKYYSLSLATEFVFSNEKVECWSKFLYILKSLVGAFMILLKVMFMLTLKGVNPVFVIVGYPMIIWITLASLFPRATTLFKMKLYHYIFEKQQTDPDLHKLEYLIAKLEFELLSYFSDEYRTHPDDYKREKNLIEKLSMIEKDKNMTRQFSRNMWENIYFREFNDMKLY